MSGYSFARALRMFFFFGFILLAAVMGLGGFIYRELATEARFRNLYAAEWQTKYEQFYEPLSTARMRIVLAAAGIIIIIPGTLWVIRIVRAPQYANPTSGRRRRRHRHRYTEDFGTPAQIGDRPDSSRSAKP